MSFNDAEGGLQQGDRSADAARVSRPDLKVLFITGYAASAVLSNGQLVPGMHGMTKPWTRSRNASSS